MVVKRSMALWARTGSAKVASHSSGPRLEVTIDGAGAVALGEDLVGVAALLWVHGVETEVVEDEEIDGEELAELGLVGLGRGGRA